MHDVSRSFLTATILAMAIGVQVSFSSAQEQPNQPTQRKSQHGGSLVKTKAYEFEVVCASNGVWVYPRSLDDKAIDLSRLSGNVTFYHPNSPKPWFDRQLEVAQAGSGRSPSALVLALDLSTVPASGAKLELKITGLPATTESTATFGVPFQFLHPPATPAARPAAITYSRATSADRAAINAQRVCVVTGQSLGSMGGPIKVTRGNKSVFLCCQSCLKTITADPDRYFR